MFDSDYNPAVRAGIPAAVRAALDHGDPAPLLRLEHSARGSPRCRGRARSRPPATPRCARRRRCRGRAARRSGSGAAARAGGGGPAGAGRVLPVRLRGGGADEIDLCLHWATRRRAPAARRRLPGGAGADPPGRRGPADAAGRLGARGGALPGVQRVVVPGVGHAVVGGDPSRCGVRRLLAFLRGRPASAPCRRVATLVPGCAGAAAVAGRLAPARGVPGRAGRTVAALDVTLDDLTFALSPALGSPLAGAGPARRELPPAARRDRPAPAAGGPRRAGERRAAARAGAPAAPVRARGGRGPAAHLAARGGARAAGREARARAAAGRAAAAGRGRREGGHGGPSRSRAGRDLHPSLGVTSRAISSQARLRSVRPRS